MFSVRAIALVAALECFVFAGSPLAQPRTPDVVVEAVLTRSLLERGAFHACAPLEPEPNESIEFVVRTWRLDMRDTNEFLQKAGYPEAYVRPLIARLDLQKATPRFAERAALQAYCAMLGNWFERLSIYQYSVPQHELQRALRR